MYPDGNKVQYLGTYQPTNPSDPIRCLHDEDVEGWPDFCGYDGPGWYFWDEVWQNLHGPFNTIEDCRVSLRNYANNL